MRSALLILLSLLAGSTEALAATRFAFVVGHNQGDRKETPLRWAEADARRVRDVLVDVGHVDLEAVTLLESPSREEFSKRWVETVARVRQANARGEETVLLFYFSGHGERTALHLGTGVVPIAELKARLANAGATTAIAVVDACQNDRSPRRATKGAHRAPAFSWAEAHEALPKGLVYLTSAASGEVAQESDDLEGSLFTHHFVAGLRGAADLDRDGRVTLSELYLYGYERTLRDTHARTTAVQHSEIDVRLAGHGALTLGFVSDAVAILRLDEDVVGHVLLVHDGTARIVAEVDRVMSAPTDWAVPTGHYRVQLRTDTEVRTGIVHVESGVTVVAARDLTKREDAAVLAKGAAYDPQPYDVAVGGGAGRSVVEGFGLVPKVEIAAGRRMDRTWRASARLALGYTTSSNRLWRYRQFEGLLSIGGERVVDADPFVLSAGPRIGLAIVRQTGERDPSDVTAAVGAQLESATVAIGPDTGFAFGATWRAAERFAVRAEVEPGLTFLALDGAALTLRWRISAALMGVFRL